MCGVEYTEIDPGFFAPANNFFSVSRFGTDGSADSAWHNNCRLSCRKKDSSQSLAMRRAQQEEAE
jgi:hypothetical protein